jgi:hypothetical protein
MLKGMSFFLHPREEDWNNILCEETVKNESLL